MFIKRKSANLFKKSAKLALMKVKKAAEPVKSADIEEDKPITTPKKGKKSSNGEVGNNNIA